MSAQPGLFPTTAAERYAGLERSGASGRQRKERGQDKALQAESEQWRTDTLHLFSTYLAKLEVGAVFAMEDFRAFADLSGHPPPRTHKVWGSMPRFYKAHGQPIARTDRVRLANSPLTHSHPVTLWVKTEPKTA
jgi:hypothetical protein